MEIRANEKNLARLRRQKTPVDDVTFTRDDSVDIPVVMILSDGKLVEYLRGMGNIRNFLKHGYNRIIRNCPHRVGKCIGEKCSLYYARNGTGDCAHIWNIELMWDQKH